MMHQIQASVDVTPYPNSIFGAEHVVLDVFEQLAVGVILLDGGARIVFANEAARAAFQQDRALRINAGIATLSPEHGTRLGNLARRAAVGTRTCALSLSAPSGRPLILLASPLRGTEMETADIRRLRTAVTMLLICDPQGPVVVPAHWITEAYGLTAAEARVALAITAGDTVSAAARRFGISVNTIKTHLRRAYAKTGASRQSELVRLIAMIGLARTEDRI